MLEIVAGFITITALMAWFNYRFIRLPLTIGVMLIALLMSLGLIALDYVGLQSAADYARGLVQRVDFTALVINGMLSFILFAGALQVDFGMLHRQRRAIAFLATIGVVASTFAVGSAAWWVFRAFSVDIPYLYCLTFGALISPTDPIAVLGILRHAGAPADMEMQIVGESLFNDGVAIVLFTLFVNAAAAGQDFTVAGTSVLFIREAGGGIAFGFAAGWLVYWMMRSVQQYQIDAMLTLALVLGGYTLAMGLGVSGPIAMVVAGLVIGNRGRARATSESIREHVAAFWELIDEILNAVLFVLIGLELLLISLQWRYLVIALPLIGILLLARWITIAAPLTVFQRWGAFRRGVTRVLTWGGLRGAISVALALALPSGPYRSPLVIVTYIIVLFSILVQGLTIGHVVKAVASEPPEPGSGE